jgi:hypothetical protein
MKTTMNLTLGAILLTLLVVISQPAMALGQEAKPQAPASGMEAMSAFELEALPGANAPAIRSLGPGLERIPSSQAQSQSPDGMRRAWPEMKGLRIEADSTTLPRPARVARLDKAGQTVIEERDDDDNGDGVTDEHRTITSSYDERGNLLSEIIAADTGVDGDIDYLASSRFVYDQLGNPLSETIEVDLGGDGTLDARITTRNAYNRGGDPVEIVFEQDQLADGVVDYRNVKTLAYDTYGQEIERVEEWDYNGDGAVDVRSRSATTYALPRGEVQTLTQDVD